MPNSQLAEQIRILEILNQKFETEYQSGFKEIYQKIAAFDLDKILTTAPPKLDVLLKLALDICKFLEKYHNIVGGALNRGARLDTHQEEFAYEGLILYHKRILLVGLSKLLAALPGETRGKYKQFLAPESMSWENFERLAWLVNPKPRRTEFKNFFPREIYFGNEEAFERFIEEKNAIDLIVEKAMPAIIRNDIPVLKQLLENISLETDPAQISQVNLSGISALVRRTREIYTYNTLCDIASGVGLRHIEEPTNVNNLDNTPRLMTFRGEIISAPLDTFKKHAILRVLQIIGELIAGNNYLSEKLQELDPSTDWEALREVRHGITHQEEKGKGAVLQQLLQDDNTLLKIANEEIWLVFVRISQIIVIVDSKNIPYNSDPQAFWEAIYRAELAGINPRPNLPTPGVQREVVTEEEQRFVIDALVNAKRTPEIIDKWTRFLKGDLAAIKFTQEYVTEVMKTELPPKAGAIDEQKETYKKCKLIIDKIRNPKSEYNTRTSHRNEIKDVADAKDAERKKGYSGLNELRKLAEQLNIKNDVPQNKAEVIAGALQALNNIVDIIKSATLLPSLDVQALLGLSKNVPNTLLENMLEAFKTNAPLYMAFEYNLGQLFQHLDRILNYTVATDIKNKSPKLFQAIRNFRNYIEHGNSAIDTEHHQLEDTAIRTQRVKKITSLGIEYSLELFPLINTINNTLRPSTPAASTATLSIS